MGYYKPSVIRVLLVDDNHIVRMGVAFYLATFDNIEVVGEASSGAEAVKLSEQLKPDIVLVDLVMPGMDGVATTRALRQRQPSPIIFLLTSSFERDRIQQALDAGAAGYIPKNNGSDIVDAIFQSLDIN